MEITIKEAKESVIDVISAGLVPFIASSPGIGKSSLAKEIAEDFNLHMIDIRLSQCDPTEINGFPSIDKEIGKASYVPMDMFPVEQDSIPAGKEGFLVLLDEFNSAPLSVQAASYALVLDKKVGQLNLHPKTVIIAAGNLETDKAITNRISTAMQSRMVHLKIRSDKNAWLSWAYKNGIDHRIISYINWKPDILHAFDPNHSDSTFPCPRTWEFLSRIIHKWGEISSTKLPVLSGTIGEGAGREFYSYCKVFKELPDITDIIKNPEGIELTEDTSTLFAITGYLGNNFSEDNASTLMRFIYRLPIEFQIITLQGAISKTPEIVDNTSIDEWISKHENVFFY